MPDPSQRPCAGPISKPVSRRSHAVQTLLTALTFAVMIGVSATAALAQQATDLPYSPPQIGDEPAAAPGLPVRPADWLDPDSFGSTLQMMLFLSVVSLAPAVLLMTTCFVRITVVLGLLRQALGAQQLPPTQVITSLALFMSLVVMSPVWKQVYEQGVQPYTQQEKDIEQAWTDGVQPIRQFMSMQIEATGNQEDIWLFLSYMPTSAPPETYDDVPLAALLPAFMLSELKTAFLIGFQIYIPFLILDMVIASVTVSMGMVMVPPSLISLPFKLLLFVLVDGWHLVVGMLMQSFQPFL